MRAKQLQTLANAVDSLHVSPSTTLAIAAEDARREVQDCGGWETIETLDAEKVLSNVRALSDERERVILLASAKAEDPEYADVAAADALRNWLLDDVISLVLDGARFRAVRELPRRFGRDYVTSESRELASGYEDFANVMAKLATRGIDFLSMAREVLDCHGSEDTLRDHVAVLRALLAASVEIDPVTRSAKIEVCAYDVTTVYQETASDDAIKRTSDILHDLARKGLASDRYVGGTSGHLFAPMRG